MFNIFLGWLGLTLALTLLCYAVGAGPGPSEFKKAFYYVLFAEGVFALALGSMVLLLIGGLHLAS